MRVSDLKADIEEMTREFLEESLRDPDLAKRSKEYRDGYQQGIREGLYGVLAWLTKRRGE